MSEIYCEKCTGYHRPGDGPCNEIDRLRAENEKLRALLTRASTHVRAERLSEEIRAATSGRG